MGYRVRPCLKERERQRQTETEIKTGVVKEGWKTETVTATLLS